MIGCYEIRYGHGVAASAQGDGGGGGDSSSRSYTGWFSSSSAPSPASSAAAQSESVTPQQFTKYMVYVTQWRWLQCERYIRTHGELGFWSMIHDCSCPQGYMSLWGRMRNLLGQYMPPVEEACAGLFPPMVQKILIINVPRVFGPVCP